MEIARYQRTETKVSYDLQRLSSFDRKSRNNHIIDMWIVLRFYFTDKDIFDKTFDYYQRMIIEIKIWRLDKNGRL